MADTVVGTVYGRDGPIAVPARGSVNLPQGVAGFALAQRHGPPELLLIVPPELEVQVGGVRSRTAARVPRGQAFVLTSDDGASAEYRFCGISTQASAQELGVTRCGYCLKPVSGDEPMVMCRACATVSCQDCSEAGQCFDCFERLEEPQ
jgi:hypothetical protein